MFADKDLLMSNHQAITASAKSSDYIDQEVDIDLGKSMVPMVVQVTENFNTLTSLTISMETDDNSGFSSAKTLFSTTIVVADLIAGKKVPIQYVPEDTERYIRMDYTVTGTNPTTGKIFAGVVVDRQTNA